MTFLAQMVYENYKKKKEKPVLLIKLKQFENIIHREKYSDV